MSLDITTLTMTELIRLQDLLSKELKQRFERHVALAFSDIVGSTPYFAKYGDEAGRKLQQRHADLLQRCLGGTEGRIVDTAGDGAFLCFPSVEAAASALIAFQKQLAIDNDDRPRDQHLQVRVGLHWGPALTDGVQVTGDSVNLCARIAASAQVGETRLSREAYHELYDPAKRLMCTELPPTELKGISRPVELVRLDWRDRFRFPDRVRIEETDEELELPPHPTITFGRLKPGDGMRGNDIVLQHPDKQQLMQISRWHFELRRRADGLVLHQVSENVTEVDGVVIPRGSEVAIRAETVVRLGRAMTLVFNVADRPALRAAELTTHGPM
jgi:class 3 adenylate cyclase